MKLSRTINTITIAVLLTSAAGSAFAAKGGKKNNDGDDSGGFIDAVFMVDSLAPEIPPVESNSADSKGQVVFYAGKDTVAADGMDLSEFTGGSYDNGTPCSNGWRDGTLVIYPQSSRNPGAAEVIFWYRDELESGDEVTHLLTMQGTFDEPGNWPPSAANPVTTITLNYWEFAAENPKGQRQDCSGSSDFPAGPWTVTVERIVP